MKSGVFLALLCLTFAFEIHTVSAANAARARTRTSDEEEDSLLVKTDSGFIRGAHKEVLGHSVQLFLGVCIALLKHVF